MNYFINVMKHIKLVSKHKWYVFKFAVKAGIPFRGFIHDLSKFSPTEFIESVKYYNGKRSPLHVAREINGYSSAWLHHKGRNKHHLEYWEDISKTERIGVFMPYKYIVEAICDKISAGIVSEGKNWNQEEPYLYWVNIERNGPVVKHAGTVDFIDTVLKKVADEGLDKALNRRYLKEIYSSIAKKYQIVKK